MDSKPDKETFAAFAILYESIIKVRAIARRSKESHQAITPEDVGFIHDLMDAIHNIPATFGDWERLDKQRVRAELSEFDEKWASRMKVSLCSIYNNAIRPNIVELEK